MCSFELLMMNGKNRPKHVEYLTEINKLRNVASCWLYSANILAKHGLMNVKFSEYYFTALIFRVQVKDGAAAFSKILAHVYENTQHHIKEHCKIKSAHEAGSTDRT